MIPVSKQMSAKLVLNQRYSALEFAAAKTKFSAVNQHNTALIALHEDDFIKI